MEFSVNVFVHQQVSDFLMWFCLLELQVALDIEYHHNMLVSHQKVNPKELIVGW